MAEVEQVILNGKIFADRERDTLEVTHYFQALEQDVALALGLSPRQARDLLKTWI
jgi:hypothetical protein